jgi:hypothetical protein
MNNISALRRNQVPQMNPVQAYQRSLMANEQLLQQKQQQQQLAEYRADQMKTSALNRQVAERGMDPAADYNDLVKQGLIDPAETSWADFQRITGSSTGSEAIDRYNLYASLTPDQRTLFDRSRGQPQPKDIGGVLHEWSNTANRWVPIQFSSAAEEQLVRQSQAAGRGTVAQEDITASGTEVREFQDQYDTQMPQIISDLEEFEVLRAYIENPDASFGPIEGRLGAVYNPETARINVSGLNQLIDTLGSVQTGALSEKEIEIFRQKALDANKSRAVNQAILEELERMLRKQMAGLNRKNTYLKENQTLEGYGDWSRQQYEARSNRLQQQPTPTGSGTLPSYLLNPAPAEAPADPVPARFR